MFRKYLFVIFAAIAPFAFSMMAYAQTAPLAGTVVFEKGGKDEPVANALVEVYRTDVKGYYKTQTNKKGEFRFVGILYGDYAIAVSAPNAAPTVFPNVRANREDIRIVMDPGDGRKYTEAEVRQAAANAPKSGESESGGVSEEERKKRADFDKQNAEITAKNEKIKAGDALAAKSNTEGNAALAAKNYDLAIAKYNEGIAAVPDFVGSTPILMKGKMIALRQKGFTLYLEGAKSSDRAARAVKYDEANKAYDEALSVFPEAIAVIAKAEATADAGELKRRDSLKHDLYAEAAEIHRLKVAGGVDVTKINEALTVINEYLALENDAAVKLATQIGLADMLRIALDFEKAVAAYREVLVLKPDHADTIGKLGLSLFGLGVSTENKELQQEGMNYMQKYVDMAPVTANDTPAEKEWKTSINEALVYLKSEKMTPQKVPTQKSPGGKKK